MFRSRLLSGEQPRADYPGARARARDRDAGRARTARAARAGAPPSQARSRNRSDACRQPAADHDQLRLERVDGVREADAQVVREALEQRERVLVALAREVDDVAPASTLPLLGQRAGRAPSPAGPAPARVASRPSAVPRAERLQAAAVGAVAGAVAGRRRGSRCGRARRPGRVAPRKIRPPMTIPPPTPVPSVYITRSSTGSPSSCPRRTRPRPARRRSRRCRRTPARPGAGSARRAAATPSSGMFTLETTLPVACSIWDGTPMPTAAGVGAVADDLATASSIPWSSSCRPAQVGRAARSGAGLAGPTTSAAATFVPPTSTPMMVDPGAVTRALFIRAPRSRARRGVTRSGSRDPT